MVCFIWVNMNGEDGFLEDVKTFYLLNGEDGLPWRKSAEGLIFENIPDTFSSNQIFVLIWNIQSEEGAK